VAQTKTKPKGLSPEEFAQLPKALTIRVIKYYIPSPGFALNMLF